MPVLAQAEKAPPPVWIFCRPFSLVATLQQGHLHIFIGPFT